MKSKIQQKKAFTIIEVLIVLAIAGLILLIVFLAVPALQRNSRNTQRSSDASRALGAAQEVLNNNGNIMTNLTTDRLQAAIGTPAYYQSANITVADGPASGASPVNTTTVDTLIVLRGARCVTSGADAGRATNGTNRQLAAVFTVETGSGTTLRCRDS
jgi:prepilin-type N-terminal cleavage/methylation domain-containing protein